MAIEKVCDLTALEYSADKFSMSMIMIMIIITFGYHLRMIHDHLTA